MQLSKLIPESKNTFFKASTLKGTILGLFIGAVLFDRPISIILLGAYVVFWWFSSSYKEKWTLLKRRKFVLLLPALFFFYSLSLIYSQNRDFFDLEKKLLLLFIPLIIGSTRLTPKEFHIILRLYVISCLAFTIVSFFKAYQFYNLPTEHFSIQHLPHQLSAQLHAPYLSLLLVLANLSILLISTEKDYFAKTDILLILYFSSFILILSSRTALFCNLLLILVYLYFKLIKKNKTGLYVASLLALIIVLGLTYTYFPHFQERVTGFSKVGNGISERVNVFKASFLVLKEHPLTGVGIGDIQAELNKFYSSWGLPESYFRLNPHNEYLYTGIAIGIPGILFLLYLLAYPVILAIRTRKPLYSAFYFIFLFAFLTEVILARYWGVAAFSFFYSIFTSSLIDFNQNKQRHNSSSGVLLTIEEN